MKQRPCRKAYYKSRYCDERRENILKRNKETGHNNTLKVFEYFEKHPCVDCGEKDPIVLEFDHVRGQKRWNVSSRIRTATPWITILEEIEKCEVRCANCHRRKTAKQRNFFKDIDYV